MELPISLIISLLYIVHWSGGVRSQPEFVMSLHGIHLGKGSLKRSLAYSNPSSTDASSFCVNM